MTAASRRLGLKHQAGSHDLDRLGDVADGKLHIHAGGLVHLQHKAVRETYRLKPGAEALMRQLPGRRARNV